MSNQNQKLLNAIKQNSLSKVRNALDRGANPNFTKQGISALFYATWEGNPDIVRLLCESGANVNIEHDETRETPLFLAVAGASLENVRTLCEFGSDASHEDYRGKTPRDYAEEYAEESATGEQIESLLETCGLNDPSRLQISMTSGNQNARDPSAYQPNENTDPQGGRRRTRKRRSTRRKSGNRSK